MACKGDTDSSSPRPRVVQEPYSQATIPGKWVNEVLANDLREFIGATHMLNK